MYASDKPVTEPKDDLLNRRNFAMLLAKSLMSLNTGDTFTVGLFGKWGSGKTSLVNMALHELESAQSELQEDEKTIVVRFEPWNFTDSNQLVSQFFVRLINCFRTKKDERLIKIGNAFEKYAGAFSAASAIPIYGELVATAGKTVMETAGQWMKKDLDSHDALMQKSYVEKLLDEQKSRILIVIDDIDRLSNDQIRYIFQLVTAVAKLPNITYLLVFDKEIVTKALETVQGGDGNDYLEKVIQMPISIPDLRKTDLNNVLFTKLNQLISHNAGIGFEQSHWDRIFQYCINPFIATLREVNRLCNSLEFKLTSIATEVDFADLCAITLIEIKFPQVYTWIKNNKPILTGEHDWDMGFGRTKSQADCNQQYIDELKPLLNDDKDAEYLVRLLSVLFPHFGDKTGKSSIANDTRASRKQNYISHPSKFERYFELNLDFIGLKNAEITNIAYHADEGQAKEAILDVDRRGFGYELLDELVALKDTLSEDRAIILTKVLFSITEALSKTGEGLLSVGARSYAKFVIQDIMKRIKKEKRFDVLSTILKDGGGSVLTVFATILNTIELAYGRLAANGKEREFDKTISLEELEQLEPLFCDRAKEILSEHCLLDLPEWRRILYMLECFRPEYVSEYMKEILKAEENVLKYLAGSITEWIGSGRKFELSGEYEMYISKEQAIQTIDRAKDSGLLFTLSKEMQTRVAAYYLAANSEDGGSIQNQRAEDLLEEWMSKTGNT